jgi:predicted metal-dependent hydrolase
MAQITIVNIPIDVFHKNIKNVHLSVYPPSGKVRISAPVHMNPETIRIFAISKLGWIKRQQATLNKQERETPREYLDRESHYYLGRRYLMKLVDHKQAAGVFIKHDTIEVHQRGGSAPSKAKNALQIWYREEIRRIGGEFIKKWEPKIGVEVSEYGIKLMKTKWGTCNSAERRIWLNLELAKKPVECIEYIVVHEMVHIVERKHDDNFIRLMNKHLPKWKFYREELNRSPLRHENWTY